jgi:hypothetical protein
MADLLKSGLSWLSSQLQDHAATTLTYKRGANEIVIVGTFARVDREVAQDTDYRIQNELRDLIVSASQLKIDNQAIEPTPGDRVLEVVDGETRTYEVLPLDGTPCWQWLGNREVDYRIHLKKVVT